MLVTADRFHCRSSISARLTVWMMLPSIWLRSPSGLMIWPQSCATKKRSTRTLPVRRFTSTSATTPTYVRTSSYLTYDTPRPFATSAAPPAGAVRGVHAASLRSLSINSRPRGSFRLRTRYSNGSAPAAAASSSRKHSLPKLFCMRPGVRIPAVLVGPAPLHAHRPADLPGDQRRVGGGILVAVSAVAARALDIEAADIQLRHVEHPRQLLAQQVRRLRGAPRRELAVLELRDRARRPDRAVRVHREVVARLEQLRRGAERRGAVACILQHLVLRHPGGAHVIPKLCLVGQSFPLRPPRLDRSRRLDRGPLVVRHDGKEAALAHRAEIAGDLLALRVAPVLERGPHRRRAHNARMDHPPDLEVVHLSEASGDFLRGVEARYRLADDRVGGRVLERRFRVELELESAISRQLGVGDALLVAANPAVLDHKIAPGDVEFLRRLVEQRLSRRRAGLPDLHATSLDREAAEGGALIRSEQGIARDELHALHRHAELLGGDLRQRGVGAGAEVDLSGVHRDHALAVDGDEAVHAIGGDALPPQGVRVDGGVRGFRRERVSDHERARGFQEVAARDLVSQHGRLLRPSIRTRASPRARCARACRSGTGCRRAPP